MLLHLSDLHFGTERPACLTAIQAFCYEQQPELVVVSGDLTQRARYREFFHCKQFLDSLNCPYLVVPGNHDIPLYHVWDRIFNPFTRYQLFFGNMEMTLETEHFYVIGVNSIRRRYHTRGHISLEQIQQIDQILKQAPAHKIKIIAAHQPFYADPEDQHSIKDCPVLGRMALEVWSQSGLKALLHGHLHQSAVFDLNVLYHLGAGHPVLDIHAGTATSYRLHHALSNSFNVIDAQADVQHYQFNLQQSRFELV